MTNIKLKILPGRGLSGKDIKTRLKNRTLVGEVFAKDAYAVNQYMDKFMKMSKVEQVAAIRENELNLRKQQDDLDRAANAHEARMQEIAIEAEVQKRLKSIRDDNQTPKDVQVNK